MGWRKMGRKTTESCPYFKLNYEPKGSSEPADQRNIAVFSEKTDVPHLPNQSMVAISVMKL